MNLRPAFLFVACALAFRVSAEVTSARVTGQRVNLRARSDLNAEVVGQVGDGDTLRVKSVQGEWVEVVPPDHIDLWVNKDLVAGNRVMVNQANVRAGPGVNYTVVGRLVRDDVVATKGAFGEWLRIAPFAAASLWVSRELVDLPESAMPAPAAPAPAAAPSAPEPPPETPQPQNVPMDPSEPVPTSRVPPADLKLIPFDGQGRIVEHEGVLRTAGTLLGSPGDFRLVQPGARGAETLAYLRGNREQLRGLLGKRMQVTGPEYWAERIGDPILIVEKIRLLEAAPPP